MQTANPQTIANDLASMSESGLMRAYNTWLSFKIDHPDDDLARDLFQAICNELDNRNLEPDESY